MGKLQRSDRRRLDCLIMSISFCLSLSSAAHASQVTKSITNPSSKLRIREVTTAGYRVKIDIKDQIISLDAPTLREVLLGELNPKIETEAEENFVTASMLALKAKEFDDGLCAAVELTASSRDGNSMIGKKHLLEMVAEALAESPTLEPTATAEDTSNVNNVIFAAEKLSGGTVAIPDGLKDSVEREIRTALESGSSKPIGFYTWSPELAMIFRRDRLLQTPLLGSGGIARLVKAMRTNANSASEYKKQMELATALSNPFDGDDLRAYIEGKPLPPDNSPESHRLHFLPPAKSVEVQFCRQLFGDGTIPEDFNLADKLIEAIRKGDISLRPDKNAGWYAYQQWALEPLVVPDKTAEIKHLRLEGGYRQKLDEMFKTYLAFTRETHAKAFGGGGGAGATGGKVILYIDPQLTVEPLATYYLRRAESYAFVKKALLRSLGAETLKKMHRLTEHGPSPMSLFSELDSMESLFAGAYLVAWEDLGLPTSELQKLDGQVISAEKGRTFRTWVKMKNYDPDLNADARMMVPIFYDSDKNKIKVWIFLGWLKTRIIGSFDKSPSVVSVTPVSQEAKKSKETPLVEFSETGWSDSMPVTTEICVDRVLDRNEFRRLCNENKTIGQILKALGAEQPTDNSLVPILVPSSVPPVVPTPTTR